MMKIFKKLQYGSSPLASPKQPPRGPWWCLCTKRNFSYFPPQGRISSTYSILVWNKLKIHTYVCWKHYLRRSTTSDTIPEQLRVHQIYERLALPKEPSSGYAWPERFPYTQPEWGPTRTTHKTTVPENTYWGRIIRCIISKISPRAETNVGVNYIFGRLKPTQHELNSTI